MECGIVLHKYEKGIVNIKWQISENKNLLFYTKLSTSKILYREIYNVHKSDWNKEIHIEINTN